MKLKISNSLSCKSSVQIPNNFKCTTHAASNWSIDQLSINMPKLTANQVHEIVRIYCSIPHATPILRLHVFSQQITLGLQANKWNARHTWKILYIITTWTRLYPSKKYTKEYAISTARQCLYCRDLKRSRSRLTRLLLFGKELKIPLLISKIHQSPECQNGGTLRIFTQPQNLKLYTFTSASKIWLQRTDHRMPWQSDEELHEELQRVC